MNCGPDAGLQPGTEVQLKKAARFAVGCAADINVNVAYDDTEANGTAGEVDASVGFQLLALQVIVSNPEVEVLRKEELCAESHAPEKVV